MVVVPAVPAKEVLVVAPLPLLAQLAAAAATAAAAAVPDLPGQPAVAAAVAVGMADAAGLDVVRGGVGPGSGQGVRGPWAGAGSQSCTMESCIFVMRCALLCSY